MDNIEKFNPTKAQIQEAVQEVSGLKIKDLADTPGYEAVKAARKKLGAFRIQITKFGKKQREKALSYQREVIRQEKELLNLIEPEETRLKNQLKKIDEKRIIEERRAFLPARRKMLDSVQVEMVEEEILKMDEKEFTEFYNQKKEDYDREQERKRLEKEAEEKRKKEIEEAKEEAKKKAREEAEQKAKEELERAQRKKDEEIAKLKREKEEKERAEREEKERLEKEEADRVEKERIEKKRAQKNQKFQGWLKENGYTEENKDDFFIDKSENTYTLYKKISSLNLNDERD